MPTLAEWWGIKENRPVRQHRTALDIPEYGTPTLNTYCTIFWAVLQVKPYGNADGFMGCIFYTQKGG